MQIYILKENVLSDNVLYLADENLVFKGQYIAIIHEYQFQNSWTDEKKVTKFRSFERLNKYLKKVYPNLDIELILL
jgi:hypothetical protein